jgi:hypothetical protein
MFKKPFSIVILLVSLFCFLRSESKADTLRNIYTPRGTLVGDSYDCNELEDETREDLDNYYATTYPNATQLTLWGEQYSSSGRYNCHGYAWHMIGENAINDPVWIGYFSAGNTYKYWQDESYSEVAVQYATMVDYSGDHSATTTDQTDIYISKWRYYPLMRHYKTYCPNYGTPVRFLRINPVTPSDFATIQAAINDAVSGQIVHVDAGVPALSSNVTIPSGITLKIHSGTNINLNGYYIKSSGGTIVRESNVSFSPSDITLKSGSTIKGHYSSIQQANDNASPGFTVELKNGLYTENVTINKNLTLQGPSSGSPAIIRGYTSISGSIGNLNYIHLEPGSLFGTALGIYNSTVEILGCDIINGTYTGWYGIWCSNSTLEFIFGKLGAGSNARVFLINAGSSSNINTCYGIKPANGIAIDGTADGYAIWCDFFLNSPSEGGWDINAYLADAGTFDLAYNDYGEEQEINDPGGHVSGDGWNDERLAKPVLITNSDSAYQGYENLERLLLQADSLIA